MVATFLVDSRDTTNLDTLFSYILKLEKRDARSLTLTLIGAIVASGWSIHELKGANCKEVTEMLEDYFWTKGQRPEYIDEYANIIYNAFH